MSNLARQTPAVETRRIAPLWHTLGLLILLFALSAGLFRLQSAPPATGGAGESQRGNMPLYLAVIVAEWALVYYVWLGGRRWGGTPLRELIGGRWSSAKAVVLDILIAAVFWVVWTATGTLLNSLLGPSHTRSLGFLNPRGSLEITLWVLMSITAGFCEELLYRGYLQRQALAISRNGAVAVLAQAVIFGAGHWYQGSKMVIVIAALGALFGILAHWRKSLRPGMISHAWSDSLNVIPIRFP